MISTISVEAKHPWPKLVNEVGETHGCQNQSLLIEITQVEWVSKKFIDLSRGINRLTNLKKKEIKKYIKMEVKNGIGQNIVKLN